MTADMEADEDFARRLLAAMRAALRQKLRMMEDEHWFFSDVQRALVRQEMAARLREP